MAKIILVDDDRSFLRVYSKILQRQGYNVEAIDNGKEALKVIKNRYFDLVISDVVMPGMGGIELLKALKKLSIDTQIIMLSGKGTVKDAVKAMRLGAYNYLLKPVDIEELLINIERALDFKKVNEENYTYRSEMEKMLREDPFIGKSNHFMEIKKKIEIIAPTDSTVLITGETGTGKEVLAKEIHYNSNKRNKPLIKVNCAVLAETVLESELFGHEKGAFTGAYKTKKGKFELAQEGTLFLDEIGDLPLNFQIKLLRVLQEKEFERVGGTETIKVNFRLIAATNKDLRAEVKKGSFREDLFYRLNVIPIYLKPLRERREDILYLAEFFLKKYSKDLNKNVKRFSDKACEILKNHDWPGNVRELKNIVERCVVFAKSEEISAEEIPEDIKSKSGVCKSIKPLKRALQEFEKQYILNALDKNEWNITKTSEEIGIARKNLYKKIEKYRIQRPSEKN